MAETRVVVPDPEAPRRTGRRGAPLRRGRTVHYTDAEWEAVREAAQRYGKAARRFVRDASLGALPAVETFRADADVIRELGRAGNAIVRLAATAREGGALPEARLLDSALAELLALVRRLAADHNASVPNDQRPE
jgi:hypothetical protein